MSYVSRSITARYEQSFARKSKSRTDPESLQDRFITSLGTQQQRRIEERQSRSTSLQLLSSEPLSSGPSPLRSQNSNQSTNEIEEWSDFSSSGVSRGSKR